jgi:hypothetical protein
VVPSEATLLPLANVLRALVRLHQGAAMLARGRGDDGGVEGTGAGASLLSVEAQLRHEVAKGLEELTGRVSASGARPTRGR